MATHQSCPPPHIRCDHPVVKSYKIIPLSISAEDSRVGMAQKVDLGKPAGGKRFRNHVCESTLKNIMCESNVSHCSSYSWLIEPVWGSFRISPAMLANPNLIYNSKQLTRWNSSRNIRGPCGWSVRQDLMSHAVCQGRTLDPVTSWGHPWAETSEKQSSLPTEQTP